MSSTILIACCFIQSVTRLAFSLQIIKDIQKEEQMEGATNLQQMGEDIQRGISELRNFCNELRPPLLSLHGLAGAIQENLRDFQQDHPQIRVSSDLSDHHITVPDPIALALYRIYQQALMNLVRHAGGERGVCQAERGCSAGPFGFKMILASDLQLAL